MTTKTDPFTTTENPLGAVTGFWTTVNAATGAGLKDINPGANASTSSVQDCVSMWALANYTFLSDHSAEVTFGTIGNGDWGAAAVRLSAASSGQGYVAYYRPEGSNVSLYKLTAGTVGGSGTFILNIASITFALGDKLKLGCVGTTLTVYKNGASIGSVTDATYTTGQPGIAYSFQNNNITVLTAWTGTDSAIVVTDTLMGQICL